jgi:hypothetical protein
LCCLHLLQLVNTLLLQGRRKLLRLLLRCHTLLDNCSALQGLLRRLVLSPRHGLWALQAS